MLPIADYGFTLLHLIIIFFNLFGWIFPSTRKWHLIVILLTLLSWLVLGIWYGIGYCPITDWQWQIKEKLGEKNLPNSFIKYMLDRITGKDINSNLIDWLTGIGFTISVFVAIYFYLKKRQPYIR